MNKITRLIREDKAIFGFRAFSCKSEKNETFGRSEAFYRHLSNKTYCPLHIQNKRVGYMAGQVT